MVRSGRRSLVVVADAVDVAVVVDGEGNAVQGLGANHAAEAAGVVGVAQSLQDLRRRHSSITTASEQEVQCLFIHSKFISWADK